MLKLYNKKIAILGIGIENMALVKYIIKHKIKCEITVCDRRKNVGAIHELPLRKNIHWQLGKNYNKNLEKFDVLFRSPGWPIIPLKKPPYPPLQRGQCNPPNPLCQGGRMLSSPMKLFFELCPTKNIIGVTGTKGKGTTASLIYEILKKHFSGKTRRRASVHLGGNIGVAPFEFLDKIKKNDWVVLELSSFQLEDMTVSPHIAVITNFYAEHLKPADPNNPNYHKSLKEYRMAKANIFRWQKAGDYLITKSQIPNPKQILNSKLQKSKIIYFKKSDLSSKLIGEHNKENIAAAVEAAKIAGVKMAVIKKAVAGFKGLEHRLELVRELDGVKYYNDSFATTPESTIIALKSFNVPVVLLLGGADKGANFKNLAKEVKRGVYPVKSSAKADGRGAAFNRVKYVVLLKGQATPRIKKKLLAAGYKNNKMKLVNNIKDAVAVARGQADRGEVVLLSTACASFGLFKNYKERGDLFKKQVKNLLQLNNFASGKISARRYLTG